jgi:hypothetical protein
MNCPVCRTEVKSLGQVALRVGGNTGWRHLVFGNLSDLREDLFPVDVYRCDRCRRVEFFDMDLSLPTPE